MRTKYSANTQAYSQFFIVATCGVAEKKSPMAQKHFPIDRTPPTAYKLSYYSFCHECLIIEIVIQNVQSMD